LARKTKKNEFEDDMKRLNEITKRLESEVVDLDESLGLYEEGIGLYRKLTKSLQEIQRKVEILGENDELEPFDEMEE
jgi:exodeoxyribonuclease VII small subunit